MEFDRIQSLVGHVPFINERNARFLYDLIIDNKVSRILELGIAHGTATCYMAAALEELGRGKIVSVDLKTPVFDPSAEQQLEQTELEPYVQIVRMKTGYNWYLHDEIKQQTVDGECQPIFDLCILDGSKNWTMDSSAFFLADKLIVDGGWLIFDDYSWTYDWANQRRDTTDGILHASLSRAERATPHIKEIFELLVKQHSGYTDCRKMEGSDWAIARKVVRPKPDSSNGSSAASSNPSDHAEDLKTHLRDSLLSLKLFVSTKYPRVSRRVLIPAFRKVKNAGRFRTT